MEPYDWLQPFQAAQDHCAAAIAGKLAIVFMAASRVLTCSEGVYAAAAALHLGELLIEAPARYPDLFPVLNVLISTPVFVLVWLWSIKCGVEVGWALGGLGIKQGSEKTPAVSEPTGSGISSQRQKPGSVRRRNFSTVSSVVVEE